MATKKNPRGRSSSLKNRGLGCLFWLCLLAIIVAVGYAARTQIADAFTRVVGSGGKPGASGKAPLVTVKPLPESSVPPARDQANPQEGNPRAQGGGTQGEGAPGKLPTSPNDRVVMVTRPPSQTEEKPVLRKTRLFFLTVDPNGNILMKGVIRPIPQSDTPLRDALETLLKGPTSQEINVGLLSMIPSGTTLRGVTVRGDVAYVDFSENFRFNSLGIDAMKAQLRQVVYAATEFPTVKKVQFLIEGKKVDYLGTEGVSIKDPLSRGSF
ncbi:MAG TPA: GerMN domain-containing protein [Spirochaetia bacterium]|nr:GerMN domain-containing protein [Spirochaetia bacterium]